MAAPHQPRHASTLLPSSIFSTPSFSSTLPLARPTSASGIYRRPSANRKSRLSSRTSQQRRRTRSVASSMTSQSDDDYGSLGSFSMENYTIDLAQLARRESGKIGLIGEEKGTNEDEGPAQGERENEHSHADEDEWDDHDEEGEGDFMGGFEVDLGGLGDRPSSVVVEDRNEEREEVPSEADGPEDFTLNMEKWMRGTGMMVKERDDLEVVGDKREPAPEYDPQDAPLGFENVEDSIMEPLGTSTPARDKHHTASEAIAEARNPTNPAFEREDSPKLQDRAANEVFQRISALHAEVERMRREDESRRWAYEGLEEQNVTLKRKNAEMQGLKELNDALSEKNADMQDLEVRNQYLMQENADLQVQLRERQPLFAATASGMGSSSPSDTRTAAGELTAGKLGAEIDRLAALEKIEGLEVSLRASHGTVRKLREEMSEDEDMHKNQMDGLREDRERLRSELDGKNGEVAELEQQSQIMTEKIEDRDRTIAKLTSDAGASRTELEHAHQQLRETRRILESVEEENDRLASQNGRKTDELEQIEDDLQSRTTELQAAHASIAKLREHLKEPSLNNETTAKASDHKETHKAVLEALKEQQQNALASLKAKFARQLQLLQTEHDAQASKHQAELEKIKQTPKANLATETELRTAIRALSSKLETANAATRAARAEAEKAQDAVETTRQDNEVVNAALEAQFAETVEAREREWRRRVAVLFRERETMGKALMVSWGKEDVGATVMAEDGGQGYRYRFVKG